RHHGERGPLQDRGGGGHPVRQDGAAACLRQGLLPRELCPHRVRELHGELRDRQAAHRAQHVGHLRSQEWCLKSDEGEGSPPPPPGVARTCSQLSKGLGSAYYDNVRPLAYPDSDAVLICFDISRPETLDSVLKKWQGETQEFCPNAKIVLVGCKLDMRTDLNTLRELSKQRLIPVTHEQGSTLARQMGAVAYVECSSKVSENSVRDVFHVTTLASVNRMHKNLKRSNSKRGLKRASQMPSRTDLLNDTEIRKDRAKSCSIM
uniref:Uncharacterized protein n=1 Tax=Gopherus agassizii TaxID=38772 RepID=A0A452IEC7_9SAUR